MKKELLKLWLVLFGLMIFSANAVSNDCTEVPITGNVTAADEVICPGETTTITLSTSLSGVTYTLYLGDEAVAGSEQAGEDGKPIEWIVGEGIYSIKAIGDGAAYCDTEITLENIVDIYVYPIPDFMPAEAVDATILVGESATIIFPGGNIQWQQLNDLDDWVDLEGETGATLITEPFTTAGEYFFRAKLTGMCFVNYSTVIITVVNCFEVPTTGDVIVAGNGTICEPLTAITITLASSLSGVTYTLYRYNEAVAESAQEGEDGEPIEWVVEVDAYSIKAIGDGTTYCDTEVTLENTVSIIYPSIVPPAPIIIEAVETTIFVGETATIVLTNFTDLDIQWQQLVDGHWVDLEDETGTTLITEPFTKAGEYDFVVKATDICDVVRYSIGVTITVIPTVGIPDISDNQAVIVGYYNILGKKLTQEPESGMYIIQYDDGTTKKVIK